MPGYGRRERGQPLILWRLFRILSPSPKPGERGSEGIRQGGGSVCRRRDDPSLPGQRGHSSALSIGGDSDGFLKRFDLCPLLASFLEISDVGAGAWGVRSTVIEAQSGLGHGQKELQCCESGREIGQGKGSPLHPESPQFAESTKENPEDLMDVEGQGVWRRGSCHRLVSTTGRDGPPHGSATGRGLRQPWLSFLT